MSFFFVASAVVAGVSAVVGTVQVVQSKKNAEASAQFQQDQADFNAAETRKAAVVAADDSRQNALRTQEAHRKYLSGLRTQMLEKSQTIEGGDLDFLNEATGDLQLRVLDESVRSQRQQAGYANNAFAYDQQAAGFGIQKKMATTAGNINIGASVLNGQTSVAKAVYQQGAWGAPKTGTS